jgi:hypothetical protein
MGFQPVLLAALLALLQAEWALAMPQKESPLQAMCLCDDVSMPECPVNYLAGRSVRGISACFWPRLTTNPTALPLQKPTRARVLETPMEPSKLPLPPPMGIPPLPFLPLQTNSPRQACDDLDSAGNPKRRMTPRPTAAATPATFKATYRGESGLNCVDLGYCYRPTKSRTTVVVSVSSGGSVTITVPVGLPSDALPTAPPTVVAAHTSEPEIVFTQERWRARERVPTKTVLG